MVKPKPSSPAVADAIGVELVELDQLVADLELRWGVARLPGLVGPEMLGRFRDARAMFHRAVVDRDVVEVRRLAPMMCRAWKALEAEAVARGHAELAPEVWETQMPDGAIMALVRTTAEAHRIAKDRPGVEIWTMAEVARVAASQRLVGAIKGAWPGAVMRDRVLPDGWAEDYAADDPFRQGHTVDVDADAGVNVDVDADGDVTGG